MPAVGGRRHERLLAQAQQIVLAQQPQHPLVVHRPALAPQQRPQPAVAVVPVRQGQPLQAVTQRRLLRGRRRGPPVPVVAGPAGLEQRAHPLPRSTRLAAAPTPGRGRGRRRVGRPARPPTRLFMSCKACPKKSSSSACWPILRSSAAIRCLRPRQLVRHRHRRRHRRPRPRRPPPPAARAGARPTHAAQRLGTTTPHRVAPLVEQLAPHPELAAQRAHVLARRHPRQRRQLELPAQTPRTPSFHPALLKEDCHPFPVSLKGSTPKVSRFSTTLIAPARVPASGCGQAS